MAGATIKIPAELFALAESSHFEGSLELPLLQSGPDDFVFEEPVKWAVDVTNTGAALLVMGIAEGVAHRACSRCLEDVFYDFEGQVEGYYLIEDGGVPSFEGDDDDVPGEDEFDVLPADHIVDIEPLIRAALLVDAPSMPLCKDDCAGLCPVCGANLNEGECGCGRPADLVEFENDSNPFAALAGFKFE